MNFDPTYNVGTIINVFLFVCTITAVFMRRDKDMESMKSSLRTHGETITEINKMLSKLTDAHCQIASAHAKLEGIIEQMREA